jgi:splicing factor 1
MEMRKVQLRELAMMNGTLRPEDIFGMGRCENCGEPNHKTWECQQPKNVTASVICTACGGAGHVTKDCKNPRPGGGMGPGAPLELDEEVRGCFLFTIAHTFYVVLRTHGRTG